MGHHLLILWHELRILWHHMEGGHHQLQLSLRLWHHLLHLQLLLSIALLLEGTFTHVVLQGNCCALRWHHAWVEKRIETCLHMCIEQMQY